MNEMEARKIDLAPANWGDGKHQPLAAVLRVRRPSPLFSLSVLDQLAQKLDEAHEHGLSHGHLSLRNVSVSREGEVHVPGLDADPDATARFQWSDGSVRSYPEPSATGQVDPEPDLRAFVGIAHEMLEGGPADAPLETGAMHDVLLRAEREPGRYEHATDLVKDLREAMLDDIAMSPEDQLREQSEASSRAVWPTVALALVVCVLFAVATILGSVAFEGRVAPPPAKVAPAAASGSEPAQDVPSLPGPPAEAIPPADTGSPAGAGTSEASPPSLPQEPAADAASPEVAAAETTPEAAPVPRLEGQAAPPEAPDVDEPSLTATAGAEPPTTATGGTEASPFVAGPAGIELFPSSDPGLGAAIRNVAPGSPAEVAGLRARDIIVSWNGQAVLGPEDLGSTIGGTAKVEFLREMDGQLVRHVLEISDLTTGDGSAAEVPAPVPGGGVD